MIRDMAVHILYIYNVIIINIAAQNISGKRDQSKKREGIKASLFIYENK